jgi:hypothetical protein
MKGCTSYIQINKGMILGMKVLMGKRNKEVIRTLNPALIACGFPSGDVAN